MYIDELPPVKINHTDMSKYQQISWKDLIKYSERDQVRPKLPMDKDGNLVGCEIKCIKH